MPKLGCPCGFFHNLSSNPDDGWITTRDRESQNVTDAHIALARLDHSESDDIGDRYARETAYEIIRKGEGRLYECPECGRLLWQRDGEDGFRCYLPEALEPETVDSPGTDSIPDASPPG